MRKNITVGIYCIENITTNKKYVGQSVCIENRWCQHKRDLNNGIHDNDYLQKAWNKYGEDDFKFYVLECCEDAELDAKEIYYINLHNTLNRDYGYNLKSGGQNGGCKATEEYRKKLSKSLKQFYKENDDVKEKRKNDALKQWNNPEIKEKIIGSNNGMYGKHHTEETKEKISKINKGRPSKFKNTTPVLCVELNKVFDSSIDAAKELNISNSILQVCYGNRKTCGGYHWKFILENN